MNRELREKNPNINYKETRNYNYKTNIAPNLEGAVGGNSNAISDNRLLIDLDEDKDPSNKLDTEINILNKSFSELNISGESSHLDQNLTVREKKPFPATFLTTGPRNPRNKRNVSTRIRVKTIFIRYSTL